jgi:hypothetical protein
MSLRWPLLLVAFAASAAGCSHGSTAGARTEPTVVVQSLPSSIPPPPFAQVLPANYRAKRIWYAHLTGQHAPEAIITSVSPPVGQLGFHSGNLQVLSWDRLAKRWIVLFDAQKTTPTDVPYTPGTSNGGPGEPAPVTPTGKRAPILDPQADVTFGPVRFAQLLPGAGAQLVFSSFENYGGSGLPGNLVVMDFHGGVASVAYYWSGEAGVRYRLGRGDQEPVIQASAEYWTAADAHCCPVRTYRFTVGRESDRYIGAISDERPWVGLSVRAADASDSASPLEIVQVIPRSPASQRLRKGDVILELVSPKIPSRSGLIGPALLDQLAKLDAGTAARIRIRRRGFERVVALQVGSLLDESLAFAVPSNNYAISTL